MRAPTSAPAAALFSFSAGSSAAGASTAASGGAGVSPLSRIPSSTRVVGTMPAASTTISACTSTFSPSSVSSTRTAIWPPSGLIS